jgi:hypothetical protein
MSVAFMSLTDFAASAFPIEVDECVFRIRSVSLGQNRFVFRILGQRP